jgi:hypothetical protein
MMYKAAPPGDRGGQERPVKHTNHAHKGGRLAGVSRLKAPDPPRSRRFGFTTPGA